MDTKRAFDLSLGDTILASGYQMGTPDEQGFTRIAITSIALVGDDIVINDGEFTTNRSQWLAVEPVYERRTITRTEDVTITRTLTIEAPAGVDFNDWEFSPYDYTVVSEETSVDEVHESEVWAEVTP